MTVGAPPSAVTPTAWVTEQEIAELGYDTGGLTSFLPGAIEAATRWLWRRTGRRWPGTFPVTVRPVLCSTRRQPWAWQTQDGWWGHRPGPLLLADTTTVELPPPVLSVDEVVVDGVTLDETAYRLIANRRLLRIDGEAWPAGQDWSRDATTARGDAALPAWAVTYLWGFAPPPDGKQAAAALAIELALVRSGAVCRLAPAVSSVSRNGESLSFGSMVEMLRSGTTGLWEVDLFTSSVNPHNVRRSAQVIRYDEPITGEAWGQARSQGIVEEP